VRNILKKILNSKDYQKIEGVFVFGDVDTEYQVLEQAPTDNPFKYSLHFWLFKKYLKKYLKTKPNDLILDVGCGIGHLLDYLNQFSNNLVGIDADLISLLYAKKTTSAEYVSSKAEKLPFKDNTFDKIISFNVLEHIENEQKVLNEIKRVAKNKAEILIWVPSLEGPRTNSKLKRLMHEEESGHEKHFRDGYYMNNLKNLLTKNNIKVIKARYSMFLFAELFTELTKLVYSRKQKKYQRQTDIFKVTKSKLFTFYKIIMPLIANIALLEDFLFSYSKKGHSLVIKGKIEK